MKNPVNFSTNEEKVNRCHLYPKVIGQGKFIEEKEEKFENKRSIENVNV